MTGLTTFEPVEGAQPSNEAYGDPVANKIPDSCGGHTGPGNIYKSGYDETGNPTTKARDAHTYVGGASDTLDRCNGITVNGQYRCSVTGAFPYILERYTGTPEAQLGDGAMAGRSAEIFSSSNALTDRAVNSYARDCG